MPDRSFYNFRASKFVDRRFWATLNSSIDGLGGSENCEIFGQEVRVSIPVLMSGQARSINPIAIDSLKCFWFSVLTENLSRVLCDSNWHLLAPSIKFHHPAPDGFTAVGVGVLFWKLQMHF